MRHAILPPAGFAEWVGRINALKRTLDQDDLPRGDCPGGFREFARWGTTSVLNIEAFPELMWKMPAPPLRTWWFYELIDVRRVIPTEELVAGSVAVFPAGGGRARAGRLAGRHGAESARALHPGPRRCTGWRATWRGRLGCPGRRTWASRRTSGQCS